MFGPEQVTDLSKGDGKRKWKQIKAKDGVVHKLGLGGNTVAYFYRTITTSNPSRVMSYYGSDDDWPRHASSGTPQTTIAPLSILCGTPRLRGAGARGRLGGESGGLA